jgi:hypothetical protein
MLYLNTKILQELVGHTNMNVSRSDYISYTEYPEQILELLNTIITIRYRNYYTNDTSILGRRATLIVDGEEVSSRPKDDYQRLDDIEIIDKEIPFIFSGEFRVLRADKVEPYILIAVSTDYSKIVVNSTRLDENDEYMYNTIVSEYAIQKNEYIGQNFYTLYDNGLNVADKLHAVSLSIDDSEPCYGILMEYLDDGRVRFVLGDESIAVLSDEESGINITNERELIEYRKNILEGVTIYGEE